MILYFFQGQNAAFDVSLVEGQDYFDINPKRGQIKSTFIIRVKDPSFLDFEKRTETQITVSQMPFVVVSITTFLATNR